MYHHAAVLESDGLLQVLYKQVLSTSSRVQLADGLVNAFDSTVCMGSNPSS